MASHARFLVWIVCAILVPVSGLAADLIAPWDPGFTDFEAYLTSVEDETATFSAVVGIGLRGGVSLGLSFAEGDDDGDDIGLIAVLTRPLGRDVELDAWIEIGQRLLPREAELTSAGVTAGFEISRSLPSAVPYLRMSASRDEGVTTFHPLVGMMLPIEGAIELHVELSSEEPESGPWPFHIAVGPNLLLGRGAKLLLELSWIHHGDGRGAWGGSMGIVIDPSQLWR